MRNYKLLIIVLLLSGCANMVVPTGGKKDEKLPVIKSTNLQKTNFNEKVIKLQFDEYIALNDPLQNISIQPTHTTMKVDIIAKTVIIKLDSNLHSNTTYTLNIDKGIKDVNEGNNYSFNYSFTTGSIIDTNYIEYEIENYSKLNNLKIGLTQQKVDSVESLKFDYLYNVSSNIIRVNGLNYSPYKIWIFTDKNADKIPDLYSPIYYDTIKINESKKINVNNWLNFKDSKIKKYKSYTKIFKPITNKETFNYKNIIYVDQDSSLLYESNNDSLPNLNLNKEIIDKINDRIKGIKTNKDYLIIIDKCGVVNLKINTKNTYKEDENFIYIESKIKIDSVNLIYKNRSDSFTFFGKINTYIESNKLSVLKLNKLENNDTVIMVIYKDEKKIITEKIILNKDQNFYLIPGNYYIEFYRTSSYENLSFNLKKLRRISTPIIKKEILLKPNWDEVLQLIF